MSDDDLITCSSCGEVQDWHACDVGGACPGNMFCCNCQSEIDRDGNVAEFCGKCKWCKRLAEELKQAAVVGEVKEIIEKFTELKNE